MRTDQGRLRNPDLDLAALCSQARVALEQGYALDALAFLDGALAEFGPEAVRRKGFASDRDSALKRLGRSETEEPVLKAPSAGSERICCLCGDAMRFFERQFDKDWLLCPECSLLQYDVSAEEAACLDEGEPSGAKLPPDALVHRRELFLCDLFINEMGLQDVMLYGVGWSMAPEILRSRGINAVGCDLWRPLIAERRKELGPNSFHHRDEMPVGARFDLISACEVFEHFLDPLKDANRLAGWLRDDAAIVGCTDFWHGDSLTLHPNADATYWRHRTHITAWTWSSMRRLAEQLGLAADFYKVDTPGFAAKVVFVLHRGLRSAAVAATLPKVLRGVF